MKKYLESTRRLCLAMGFCLFSAPSAAADDHASLLRMVPQLSLAEFHQRVDALVGASSGFLRKVDVLQTQHTRVIAVIAGVDQPALDVVITCGTHGNEPIACLSLMTILERVAARPELLRQIRLTFIPAINTWGLKRGIRHSMPKREEFVDINRDFTEKPETPEAKALMDFFKEKKVDLLIDLHGSFAGKGYFVIGSGEDAGIGLAAVGGFSQPVLLETSEDDQYPGSFGSSDEPEKYKLEAPGYARTVTPGTFKGFVHIVKHAHAYTLEYPVKTGTPAAQDALLAELAWALLVGHVGPGR